jgi:hypothetical protein
MLREGMGCVIMLREGMIVASAQVGGASDILWITRPHFPLFF